MKTDFEANLEHLEYFSQNLYNSTSLTKTQTMLK